ncbi:electron transfer flavoprotein subunit alpha/FixB family protein [Corynebacterium sp. 3HC-13]|uniref:electron transfer flavoprotein subunit alpha/FixB family protein n=1 Tax=Corynebacterium poyangense TaxID=2684405 RepID=UPI001CCA428C|nr:electron transfer flavoprotein subunit alpha/FixB family protein [Corynebacterium poyangense]MBZ8177100.1 electron transfer flavoprotein subunit alpha/FixB family protein [Corynebacterium poyangense]
MSNINVFVEHYDGKLSPSCAELCTVARELGEVNAYVYGSKEQAQVFQETLAALGVQRIFCYEDYENREEDCTCDSLISHQAQFLQRIICVFSIGPVLLSATAEGNEIAGRLAVRMGSGVLTDVTGIDTEGIGEQSIFGDRIITHSAVKGLNPVYTLRPGAVSPRIAAVPGAAELCEVMFIPREHLGGHVVSFTPAPPTDRPELSQAKTVVAAGRGIGKEQHLHDLIEPLADSLGAAVGVTRDVVDLGWYPTQYQIGHTGVSISPDLYLAVGVSGANHHTSGIQSSGTIIAINNDEDAPIFQIADLGVIGDLFTIIPELTKEIQTRL